MEASRISGLDTEPSKRPNIVFFHPDLGIGGAERLIVDAAVGLQGLGHKVTIFTSHCDPRHCFEEARDGTLDVRVRGHTVFPSAFLNRFHILLATFRQIHLILAISLFSDELRDLKPDIFLVDQLSACVPLLRWLYPIKQRVLFYCHFPDQLLAQRTSTGFIGIAKSIYRYPFDWFEGWSMSGSDSIIVNSKFTRSVARRIFPALPQDLGVIYPCVDVHSPAQSKNADADEPLWPTKRLLLSINRFERKKSISLALHAYHALPLRIRSTTRLVIAGGYDPLNAENMEYHKSLVALADSLGLSNATARTVPTALAVSDEISVLFLLSVPSAFKINLLANARLLIYTPANEHFGIVPVEAMQQGVPVLAANSGGPLETIIENQTGWLRDPDTPQAWTDVMTKVLSELSQEELDGIGRKGRERATALFSREIMAQRFQDEIDDMLDSPRRDFVEWRDILLAVGVAGAVFAALFGVVVRAYFGIGVQQRRIVRPGKLREENGREL